MEKNIKKYSVLKICTHKIKNELSRLQLYIFPNIYNNNNPGKIDYELGLNGRHIEKFVWKKGNGRNIRYKYISNKNVKQISLT